MAITPSQWSHILTIPESYTPSAATSGQTLVITESVIAKLSAGDQTTFWSNVANGGGDVRICTDSAGANQLPVEVVSLDNGAQTCVIWTRKATYTGTGELYVFIGKAGETQPAVTDPFGRNAVWVDYVAVYHMQEASGDAIDSTGNGYDLERRGGITSTSGKFGGALRLEGENEYLVRNEVNLNSETLSWSLWFKPTAADRNFPVFSISNNGDNTRYKLIQAAGGESGDPIANVQRSTSSFAPVYTSSGYTPNQWEHAAGVFYDSNSRAAFLNGGNKGVDSTPLPTWFGANRIAIGALIRSSEVYSTQRMDVQDARVSHDVKSDTYIATEYANQNDPASFYGTPTIAATGDGGAVEQPVVSVNAEELHQANTLSISAFNSISSVIAEQVESANLIDVFLSQLASSIQAQETHDATALNIEQSASQAVNSINAEQTEQANSISITQSLPLNSVQAQENQQANTLTVEQSAGQSITLNTAQQVEQAAALSLSQQQALAHIVAEQLSAASVTDASNLQAVTMIIAEESHQANTLNVEQYTGQFVTLITAEQKSEAQTVLISEVSAIDVLQAEQFTNAETMAFSQVQRLTQITAEQLTEAQLLTILTSGDNTDLSGLRLIAITPKYSITPISNPNTLSKV